MAKIALSEEFQAFSWKFRPLKNIFRTLENDHSIRHQSIPPLSAGRNFKFFQNSLKILNVYFWGEITFAFGEVTFTFGGNQVYSRRFSKI